MTGDQIPITAQVGRPRGRVRRADRRTLLSTKPIRTKPPFEMIQNGECGAFNPLLIAVPARHSGSSSSAKSWHASRRARQCAASPPSASGRSHGARRPIAAALKPQPAHTRLAYEARKEDVLRPGLRAVIQFDYNIARRTRPPSATSTADPVCENRTFTARVRCFAFTPSRPTDSRRLLELQRRQTTPESARTLPSAARWSPCAAKKRWLPNRAFERCGRASRSAG